MRASIWLRARRRCLRRFATRPTPHRIESEPIADSTAIQAAESHTVLEAADLVRQQARGIERATGEQALTSRHIGERALHMSELTEQVRRATREQAQVSRSIAEAMEELTTAVEQIRAASDEQSAGADQVMRAVETIKEVVSRNQASISGINSAVDLLVREAELLNREVEIVSLPVPERGGHLRFALRASQVDARSRDCVVAFARRRDVEHLRGPGAVRRTRGDSAGGRRAVGNLTRRPRVYVLFARVGAVP